MQPKTEKIIAELLENDVPFTIFLADDNYYPRHLSEEMLDSVQRIILVDPINWYNEQDQLILMKHQHKIESTEFISPVSTSQTNVFSIPWGNRNKNEHIIHLLNRDFNADHKRIYPQSDVEVTVKDSYLEPTNLFAYFYSPEREPIKLNIIVSKDKFSVIVPELNIWGLLYLGDQISE